MTDKTSQQPDGIKILAILGILFGVLMVIFGITFFGFSGISEEQLINASENMGLTPEEIEQVQAVFDTLIQFAPVFGITLIALGAVYIASGYGLWTLKSWARTLTIALTGLFAIVSIILLSFIGIIIAAIILWYLFTPRVKDAFSQAPAAVMPQNAGGMEINWNGSAPQNEVEWTPSPSYGVNITCPDCGETFAVTKTERPIEIQCPHCGKKGTLKK